MSPLLWFSVGLGLLALVLIVMAVDAFRRRRGLSGVVQILVGIVFLALGALGGVVAVGTVGYHALTLETVAATATVAPEADGSHVVAMQFPDGHRETFVIRGDELYVDAQILKWHPAANVLGLHTEYALDRIAGRYRELDDEQTQPRTVYPLHAEGAVDLFELVQRFPFLTSMVDATYGSGTFTPIGSGGTFEIRVSTSGLLVRAID